MTFQLGDKVIYPNHGLGIVERIEEKTILGTTCGFFHLRIVSNDTTVLVPVANVDNVGLRKAITDEEVERLFALLSDGHGLGHRTHFHKMRTGSIYDMADVLKSLTFLSKSKSLSFREKRMLDRAKALIISEVSEVMRQKALDVESRVDGALEKCFVVKARNIARATARAKVAKVAKPTVKAPVVLATPRRTAARAS